MTLREQARYIYEAAIAGVLPDAAVERALEGLAFSGRVILVAAGKAAWQMARAAYKSLGERIDRGIVITKYGHIKGPVGNYRCYEAGHPVPDENSFAATGAAVDMVSGLSETDTVLYLLSGGGSALFEVPLIPGPELQNITDQLLACGADIVEMNTIRKRLSAVKGGKFAQACVPAQVFCVVLSDIVGDPVDMIASGPACADPSTCDQALEIVRRYGLDLSAQARECLQRETVKALSNVRIHITGSVGQLCQAAAEACRALGYEPRILTDRLTCQAKEAGAYLAREARAHYGSGRKLALIAGGETVVRLSGTGKGGRNQEVALSAAAGIEGLDGVCVFSVGSDGTDGPTDAAGGYADGKTAAKLRAMGISIEEVLRQNDAYHALEKTDGLIFTGPTGTNVNDVAVVLLDL